MRVQPNTIKQKLNMKQVKFSNIHKKRNAILNNLGRPKSLLNII